MTTLIATKTNAEEAATILAENEKLAELLHAGESFMVHVINALDGTKKLIINSALGEDLIIDFAQ